ncbi:MAG: hypothetical protein LQ343_004922 [Gyalolechia ehrenbergii]|nr:MAG: hypothetical protein LQ343_004922 [Gyalolechia ehrenbergii]
MPQTNYFGNKPTQIRPTASDYLPPSDRSEIMTAGYIYKTHWTRKMLERLQQLNKSDLDDTTILRRLQEEFGAPGALAEMWQERAFLAMGSRNDATWNYRMEEKVIELYSRGLGPQEITDDMMKKYGRPNSWTETYRKMQELKLAGAII